MWLIWWSPHTWHVFSTKILHTVFQHSQSPQNTCIEYHTPYTHIRLALCENIAVSALTIHSMNYLSSCDKMFPNSACSSKIIVFLTTFFSFWCAVCFQAFFSFTSPKNPRVRLRPTHCHWGTYIAWCSLTVWPGESFLKISPRLVLSVKF